MNDFAKDKEPQGDEDRLAGLRRGLSDFNQGLKRHFGAILLVVTLIVVGSAGYVAGLNHDRPRHVQAHAIPSQDDGLPVIPALTCGAPTSTDPGTEIPEPTETAPSVPCIMPDPDVIVLISPEKAKALPAGLGGVDCEMTDGYALDYAACDTRPASDVETIAKKVLTPEQLAFVNDHVLSQDAYWAFDVMDTATLKNQFMVPGASYDASNDTITVYIW